MAAVVLPFIMQAAAGAAGAGAIATGLAVGAAAIVGGIIDNAIRGEPDAPQSGPTPVHHAYHEGARLSGLGVQASSYGKSIKHVYGSARIAGNVIWSRPITEHSSDSTDTRSSAHSITETHTRRYSYTVTLAIAICSGPITAITRCWANTKLIDVTASNYTIYLGDESQLPDSTISSFESESGTPAYRGLAYIVIRDFCLSDYGERIPNFTFEVKRNVEPLSPTAARVEHKIRDITLGAGVGEYLYDTVVQERATGEINNGQFIQQGLAAKINLNNLSNKADVLVALDDMRATLPNVEWVCLPVYWFYDRAHAVEASIRPAFYSNYTKRIMPDAWSVAKYKYDRAYKVTHSAFGTPSDLSLIRIAQELKGRGYKIMFYPKVLLYDGYKELDVETEFQTLSYLGVDCFFECTDSYTKFILHYARLEVDGVKLSDYIDAFALGGRTMNAVVTCQDPHSKGIQYILNLAASVKAILPDKKLIYSAWCDTYHSINKKYYLDPIWSDSNIDAVGIEAYWPLTGDSEGASRTYKKIYDGWSSGEGWSYVYADSVRAEKHYLTPTFAWKNIEHWWSNFHYNPDKTKTAWEPKMKPIWITALGFGSVDGCSNQMEVFESPYYDGSRLPRASRGRVDSISQRVALEASLDYLNSQSCGFIERKFVRFWDARPYPYYPALENRKDIWPDTAHWYRNCSIQGKLGLMQLSSVVEHLLASVGYKPDMYDSSQLNDLVRGFVIGGRQSVRLSLEQLAIAYFFDVVELNGKLSFVKRGNESKVTIDSRECIVSGTTSNTSISGSSNNSNNGSDSFITVRLQELELPKQLDVIYLNSTGNYEASTASAQRQTTHALDYRSISLPIVLSTQEAQKIADVLLMQAWITRTQYRFILPPRYMWLKPCDAITVQKYVEHEHFAGVKQKHLVRIVSTKLLPNGVQEISAVAEDASSYDYYSEGASHAAQMSQANQAAQSSLILSKAPKTELLLLDLPAFSSANPQEAKIAYAVTVKSDKNSWRGAAIYATDGQIDLETGVDDDYDFRFSTTALSTTGTVLGALAPGPHCTWDKHTEIIVSLINGELASATDKSVFRGANLCLIGDELLQFQYATFIDANKYRLRRLLRGRKGTEHAIDQHKSNERFVLLNNAITKEAIPPALFGVTRNYRAVTLGNFITNADETKFKYEAISLKPYAPCHIKATRSEQGDINISWKRRTRINGDWLNKVDVMLAEEREVYEVDILGKDQKIKRAIRNITLPTTIYTAEHQMQDFGALPSALEVNVYQCSSLIGRGNVGRAIV